MIIGRGCRNKYRRHKPDQSLGPTAGSLQNRFWGRVLLGFAWTSEALGAPGDCTEMWQVPMGFRVLVSGPPRLGS